MIAHVFSSSRNPAVKLALAGFGGLICLALQACTTTNMPQPKYPIYMQDKPVGETPPPVVSEALPTEDVPPTAAAVPAGPVEVRSLDLPPPPPPSAEMLTPAPAPAAVKPAVSVPTAGATPVKSGAAFSYTLQAKDTLYGISRRFGVPVKTLYSLNGLAPDAALRIGQKILLPDSAADKGAEEHANGSGLVKLAAAPSVAVAKPPVTTAVPAASKPAVVTPSVTAPKPTVAAPVAAPAKPTVAAPAPSATATQAPKPAVAPPSATAAAKPPVAKPAVTAPPPVAGFPGNAQIAQMGKGKFVWPIKGRILVPFGQLGPNIRNDGINVAASAGTDIHAASDGVVVYEGDQVKELGNTIYIKHPDGWYTGYSHLSSMAVKNNERVTKGQVIGKVGQTGTIDQPQLHFEIRYTPSTDIARPVDPSLVLP